MIVSVLPSLFEVYDPIVDSFNSIGIFGHWIGSDRIGYYPIWLAIEMNHKRLSLQVLKAELRCKSCKRLR